MGDGERRARGLVLQHGSDGPPAILAEWLGERGIPWEAHATWREALPVDPVAFDWIATLGSEHTPGKSDAPQWVSDEVAFLARALDAGVPVLGLCFGGQALAAAAGGAVTRSDPPEVGWMEIETADPALVPAGPWLHYHYDLLEAPPGSTVIARSAAGPAAFALGSSLGLQFHPESTPEIAALWAAQDEARLGELGIDPQLLRAQGERVAASAARAARQLFDAWWDTMSTLSRRSDGMVPSRAGEEEQLTGQAAERGNAESVHTDVAAARSRISPAVSTVRVVYPDLHGIQRGKDVPIAELEPTTRSGLGFCWAVMGTDLRHTPVVGGEQGYPDMVARLDLSTLVELPWEPDVVCCLADLERDDAPEPTDQRGLVRRAEAALAELGFTAKIGPELEFFLCEPDGAGGWRRHVDNLSMVYTVGPQADPQGVFRGLVEACAALGIGAIAGNHEYMNSQYEINLRETTPLAAADNAFRFKAAVKDYSAQRGLLATFMGKPFNDQGGSGTHMHISLEREGSNCMHDKDSDGGLSSELRQFVAGVLEHAPALMAFLNPTINAYRRILPDSLAPTHGNWGLNNRTTFVRIPPERGSACRLEIRIGDGAANPYLITAAILFAGLDGLRRELDPPAPLEGDTYALPESEQGAPLPHLLGEALDALEGDGVIRDAVGAEIVDTFLAMKRFEIERYRMHVSDWDLDEYMHHL